VAVVNDKLVGYHLVRKVPYQRDLFAGCVYTLWVSPDFRRKGIGSALKERGESWARGLKLDHIFTWIHTKNVESLSLNKEMGYEVTHSKLRKKL
jgi:GNAT superfamily N-acetyltransferase